MIPSGLFGSTIPYQSGDPGTGGSAGGSARGYSMPTQTPDPHAKLKRIIGIIGDFAGGLAGRPPIYAEQEQKNHEEMLQAQREQQQLANEYAMYDYKQAHPEAKDPSEFDQNAIAGGYVPGTPEWTTLHKNHADEMADPVVQTPNGMMLRSQAITQMQGQPAPAGVTFTPITEGGPGGSPSGAGFPHIERYYGRQ